MIRKTGAHSPEALDSGKELERLYLRRSSIDELMRSLEEYDRWRPQAARAVLNENGSRARRKGRRSEA